MTNSEEKSYHTLCRLELFISNKAPYLLLGKMMHTPK